MTKQELAQYIAKIAVLHGDFTLRSGRKSTYYIDKYLFVSDPKALTAVAKAIDGFGRQYYDKVAGAELGGIPLATAVSIRSGSPAIYVRNQKKEYGSGKKVEGPAIKEGDRILLVEDICTTGGQIVEAAKDLESLGGKVVKIISTVDREEGATENITSAGYNYTPLFTKSDLGL